MAFIYYLSNDYLFSLPTWSFKSRRRKSKSQCLNEKLDTLAKPEQALSKTCQKLLTMTVTEYKDLAATQCVLPTGAECLARLAVTTKTLGPAGISSTH
jgi:hypothetical protein